MNLPKKMIRNNIQTFSCKSEIKSALALKDQNFTFSKSILENYERFLKDFSFSFLAFLSQHCSSIFLEVRRKIARHFISKLILLLIFLRKQKWHFCVFASIFQSIRARESVQSLNQRGFKYLLKPLLVFLIQLSQSWDMSHWRCRVNYEQDSRYNNCQAHLLIWLLVWLE